MKLYHYNKDTKVFTIITDARRDPKEKKETYLIPGNSTTKKVPVFKEYEEAVFINENWEIKRIKIDQPSKYHTWSDLEGWEITVPNQSVLDKEVMEEVAKIHKEKKKVEFLKKSLEEGFPYDGKIYQTDQDSMKNWLMLELYAERLSLDAILKIRSRDNTMNDISVDNYLKDFMYKLLDLNYRSQQKYWDEVDKIK